MLAPPYASVYLSEDQLLFGQMTLDVRERYEKFGLAVCSKVREPDDHIGNELAFLAFLCRKAARFLKDPEQNEAKIYRNTAQEFLSDHLLLWIPPFCSRVQTNAETTFYKGIASLTEGTLSILSQTV